MKPLLRSEVPAEKKLFKKTKVDAAGASIKASTAFYEISEINAGSS